MRPLATPTSSRCVWFAQELTFTWQGNATVPHHLHHHFYMRDILCRRIPLEPQSPNRKFYQTWQSLLPHVTCLPGSLHSQAFTAIQIGMIIASTWILMLNAVVGYQLLDDGTPLSLGLIGGSAAILFIGTGYIALDTGFQFTNFWNSSYHLPNRNIALYVLYQLAPLIFIVAFFVLESVLVLRVLGEVRPMIYLVSAALLFAIGQVFNYTISPYICTGTSGRIDGALFETLFTLLSVVMVWIFWSSITEDDWPMPVGNTY